MSLSSARLFVRIDAGLTFIPFVVDTETDAFNLFETLNDRGLNLSALDLIKNKVLQRAKDSEEIIKFDSLWQETFGKSGIIPANKSQMFLRNYLMTKKGHISNNQVYDTCKARLSNNDRSKTFLNEILIASKHFRALTVVAEAILILFNNHANIHLVISAKSLLCQQLFLRTRYHYQDKQSIPIYPFVPIGLQR